MLKKHEHTFHDKWSMFLKKVRLYKINRNKSKSHASTSGLNTLGNCQLACML